MPSDVAGNSRLSIIPSDAEENGRLLCFEPFMARHSKSFSSFSDLADFTGETLSEASSILYNNRKGIEDQDASTSIYRYMHILPTIKENGKSDDGSTDNSSLHDASLTSRLVNTAANNPQPRSTLARSDGRIQNSSTAVQRRLSLVRRAMICPCSGELNISCNLPHKCVKSSKICEKRCTSITSGVSPAFVRSHIRRCRDEECTACVQLREAAKKAQSKLNSAAKESEMDVSSDEIVGLEEMEAEDMECEEIQVENSIRLDRRESSDHEDEEEIEEVDDEYESEIDGDDL